FRRVLFQSSRNQGETFTVSANNHDDFHVLAFDRATANTIYIATDGGVYRSTAAGNSLSWTFISQGLESAQAYGIADAATNPSVVAAGLQDNANVRTDGTSTTWVGPGGAGDGQQVAIDPTNSKVLYGYSQNVSSLN